MVLRCLQVGGIIEREMERWRDEVAYRDLSDNQIFIVFNFFLGGGPSVQPEEGIVLSPSIQSLTLLSEQSLTLLSEQHDCCSWVAGAPQP